MISRALALLALTGCAAQVAPARSTTPVAPASPVATAHVPACELGSAEAALGSLRDVPTPELVARLGTGADPYWMQDGVWLAHAPVLINEDFDFGTAMGLGAIGAGLAAKQRMEHNAARATERTASELPPEAVSALDALRACGIHRYLIDWAGPKAGLRLVTDTFDAEGKRVATDARELGAVDAWWTEPVVDPG